MRVNLYPDTIIGIFLKNDGIEYPLITTVKTVQRGVFSVDYAYSINGMAKIVTHGTSEDTGHYWFEFEDLDNLKQSFNVVKIEVLHARLKPSALSGTVLITGKFIDNVVNNNG